MRMGILNDFINSVKGVYAKAMMDAYRVFFFNLK